jgi:hypothetical protein
LIGYGLAVSFLFGDSTPTPFQTNLLEDLRDAIDFATGVAAADQQVVTAAARADARRAGADAEAERMEGLVRAMLVAAAGANKGAEGSPTATLAGHLATAISERHSAASAAVTAKLAEDIRAIDAATNVARAQYRVLLERYLLARDPPASTRTIRLTLNGTDKDEARYQAELVGHSRIALDWTLEIAIPADGVWAKPLRVEKLADDLAIVAPQKSGLIKKEVKKKKTKIDRYFVTSVVDEGKVVRLSLREGLDEEAGFDLAVDSDAVTIDATRTADPDDPSVGRFDIEKEDEEALLTFARKVRDAVRALPRKRLVVATFDGKPFDGTDDAAQPHLVEIVVRLVKELAPAVNAIAGRSRTDDELILRRMLTDGKREEIFLSKTTLYEKVQTLDESHRVLFMPLNLRKKGISGTMSAVRPEDDPPPSIRSEVPPSERDSGPVLEVVEEQAHEPSEPPPPPPPPPPNLPPANPPPRKSSASLPAVSNGSTPPPPSSRNPELVATLKGIAGIIRDGNAEEAYRQFAALFTSTSFMMCSADEQRTSLKLMLLGKTAPAPGEDMKSAYRAAQRILQALVNEHREPSDYEMLGITYVALDEPSKASDIFKKALEIERGRDPGSDLCGNLMRRVSQL